MISKITKLHGIGTLHAPLINGALSLKARTIIYGENGRGKTTLVAVLRSLACGETSGLRQRKTIHGIHPQSAEFLIGTQPHALSNDAWSKAHPDICVFDATFVSENVYSGGSVEPDHRKNLLNFAIDNQGVLLARKVDEFAVSIADKRTEESSAKEKLKAYIKGNLTPEQFAYLPPAGDGAEQELEMAKKNRDAIARASTIQSLQTVSPIAFAGIERTKLLALFEETLELVSADAAEIVQTHVNSFHVTEAWLEEGSRLDAGARCPFCAQGTQGNALVAAYKLSFSEAYKNLKSKLSRDLEALLEMISREKWSSVRATVDGNRSKLVPWNEFLGNIELPFDLETNGADVQSAFSAVRAAIRRKFAAPLEEVSITAEESAALDMLERTVTCVDDYNASQVAINAKIASLKDKVSTSDVSKAEAQVHSIEDQIARKSASAKAAAEDLIDAVAARKRLEHEKDAARSTLDTYMKKIVGQYKDSINRHLKGCGTVFQIRELKTVYTGAKPRFDYVIEMFGTPVDLSNKVGSSVAFESAMSLGDRSALAFAFFLAKLENDTRRAQQTVVFDDPLSSLDSCRRLYTRRQIAELAPTVAQLILLTHEEATVADIANMLVESDCAIFALKAHGDFSVFAPASVKDITASDYARNFESLAHYLHGSGHADDVVKRVRPFLEMNLRYRFPEYFGPDQSLGKMIRSIKSCDISQALWKMNTVLPDLEWINDYTTTYSHGDQALVNVEKMLDSDLKSIVTKALHFARGLPSQ